MSLLNIDWNDLEITKINMCKVTFLERHLDAFITFYEEQGKAFWLQYIISFREAIYKNHLTDIMSSMSLCKHLFSHVSDDPFITIHREFIEPTKSKKVKSALRDMLIVVVFYIQSPIGLGSNPFKNANTKSSFIRFFGCDRSISGNQIMHDVVAPAFICFTSNLHHLLECWMRYKRNPNNTKSLKWVHPPEWTKSEFIPTKFEHYIACYYGNTLEKELNIDPNVRIMHFPNRPEKPNTPFDVEHWAILNCTLLDCTCQVSFKKCVFNELQYKLAHNKEDLKNLEVLDPNKENSTEISCSFSAEEVKKTIMYKLAMDNFLIEERLEKISTHQKVAGNKKLRNKLKSSSATCNCSQTDSSNSEAAADLAISKSFVTKQVVQKCKEKGLTNDNLKQVKDNIDKIEKSVKEKGSLDTEHRTLMLETGAILKSPDKYISRSSNKGEKNCETKEPKKVKNQPTIVLAETESKKESSNESVVKTRSCTTCHVIKDEGIKLKKCALCVKENVSHIRYYCSRECQTNDWIKCHKTEHDKGIA